MEISRILVNDNHLCCFELKYSKVSGNAGFLQRLSGGATVSLSNKNEIIFIFRDLIVYFVLY